MPSSELDQYTPQPTTTATVVAGLFLGTVAFMVTGIQPALLGALVEEKRLTEAMLGRLAWVEIAALALAAAIGPKLLRLGSARRTVAAACLMLALANAEVYVSHDQNVLFASRLLAGLMEGLLIATANIAITRARHPHRLNATFLMVSAIPQAVAAYTLPALVIPRFGADAGFGMLCALAAMAILVAFLVGPEIEDAPFRRPGTRVWTPAVLIGLCGVMLQNAANGAGWEYQARVGENLHFSGGVVGDAIAANLIFQVIGTFAVAWVAWRLPFKTMLLSTAVMQACILLALSLVHAPYVYIALCALHGMLWLGAYPYQVSLLIHLDSTRQVALLLASLQLAGFSLGPLICSFFVSPGNVAGAFWCASLMVLLAFGLYAAAIAVANVTPIAQVATTASAVD
jgi:MFS transporter, DHA1 family, inner membrane transport protein